MNGTRAPSKHPLAPLARLACMATVALAATTFVAGGVLEAAGRPQMPLALLAVLPALAWLAVEGLRTLDPMRRDG